MNKGKHIIPYITVEQMIKVDELMLGEFELDLEFMMEQAGQHLATVAADMVDNNVTANIIICVGSGNNGGGGLVAARYLFDMGYTPTIVLTKSRERLKPVPAHQLQRLVSHTSHIVDYSSTNHEIVLHQLSKADLIIDAIIGYGVHGPLHIGVATIVDAINTANSKTLSLDIPTGLHNNSIADDTVIQADITMTLALPKVTLKSFPERVGKLYLANIGIPHDLYHQMGIRVSEHLFDTGNILEVTTGLTE